MRRDIRITGKTLAASLAVFCGVVLALAATIAKGAGAVPVDALGRVRTILEQKDHVTPGELARWLAEKRQDYQLVDIRQPWQFDDYHIPTAVNIPLPRLFQPAGLKQLSRGKKVVLYGLGAGHAAQAQLLLSLQGYAAYSLREGISAWWNEVMTPLSLRSEGESPTGYLQAKQLRAAFGGAAPGGAVPPPAAAATPAPPPSPTEAAPAPGGGGARLKLGRGCS